MIHETVGSHNVKQVVGTANGYIVLYTGEAPGYEPLVQPLDENGFPISTPIVLDGAEFAQGIAARGDQWVVVAGRSGGELQMRSFDLNFTSLGPWVCLASGYDGNRPAAVTALGDGYAIMHTTPEDGLMLHRTDDTGEGAP
jgi:hypothetical protein